MKRFRAGDQLFRAWKRWFQATPMRPLESVLASPIVIAILPPKKENEAWMGAADFAPPSPLTCAPRPVSHWRGMAYKRVLRPAESGTRPAGRVRSMGSWRAAIFCASRPCTVPKPSPGGGPEIHSGIGSSISGSRGSRAEMGRAAPDGEAAVAKRLSPLVWQGETLVKYVLHAESGGQL